MGRGLLSGRMLAVLLACVLGVACATAETDWRGVPTKTISAADRKALRKALAAAANSVPAPPAPYVENSKESTFEVDAKAPWDRKTARYWSPASATAERYYEVPDDAVGVTEVQRNFLGPIELSVEINRQAKIGDLGSEGGPQTLFPMDGAVAIEVSTIAPGEPGGRVATQSPEQAEYRLTALTVIVGDENLERSAKRLFEKEPGELGNGVVRETSNPAEVRSILVHLHGPKKPVEEFARRISTTALRRLLRH